MKASDLLVEALEREGVAYIFGIPGEENLDLLESLRESSIRLIVTRHEQAAGFMAATYGRLTGMHVESYGASGHRLQRVSELVPLVQSCFDQRGVHVIDVPVDYSENDRILHDEIQELSQQI